MSTENKDRQEEQQATNQTVTETQEQDNGLPKTQEELDALIAKRIARERKKMNSQQQGQTPQKNRQGKPAGFIYKIVILQSFSPGNFAFFVFFVNKFQSHLVSPVPSFCSL